uniref:Transposase n=1 Tax=Timema tahoe TaxID=61484 RepID=A0A7R9ILF1_9NEOP|nr:unnamed protein product [Timema tahoe]
MDQERAINGWVAKVCRLLASEETDLLASFTILVQKHIEVRIPVATPSKCQAHLIRVGVLQMRDTLNHGKEVFDWTPILTDISGAKPTKNIEVQIPMARKGACNSSSYDGSVVGSNLAQVNWGDFLLSLTPRKRWKMSTLLLRQQWSISVLKKSWSCQHSKKNKTELGEEKYYTGRNTCCKAKIQIKIKKVNRNTKKNDHFLRREVPLPAVITICSDHNHSTECVDALRLLRPTDEAKQRYMGYFDSGMSPSEARQLHRSKILVGDEPYITLANGSKNPPPVRTIYAWHKQWRKLNYGNQSNPLEKIRDNISAYKSEGIDVMISDKGPWAVLIVTPIMKRAQELPSSAEIVFIDSTSPEVFMTDNSTAEKQALRAIWPDSKHLNQWRRNLLYANSAEELENAKVQFDELCKHRKYKERVNNMLSEDRIQEWVSLFRSFNMTRTIFLKLQLGY